MCGPLRFQDFLIAADTKDFAATNGQCLLNGELLIDSNDFAAMQDQVRLLAGADRRMERGRQTGEDACDQKANPHGSSPKCEPR